MTAGLAPHARMEDARALAAGIGRDSRPASRHVHVVDGAPDHMLLIVNGSRLYAMTPETAEEARALIAEGDDAAVERWLWSVGLALPPAITNDLPAPGRVHALSLAVAQKCNLGCSYCYAQQGSFGGAARNMSFETARAAIDLLMREASAGDAVSVTFLGGEPLQNRAVVRAATEYAAREAADRGVRLNLSLTTNGTLVTPADAEFFEAHGFAVTVSIDGPAEVHDRLRPFKGGRGSFDRTIARIRPLLERQRRMQVSARVTVTPLNLDLLTTLDQLIGMGFHSVGFSPLLRAPSGVGEMDSEALARMLEAMIRCGLSFEEHVIRGGRYPFLNMTNALRELHQGTHRPYPCGAGAGYFGVSADGDLSACHRFVGDREGQLGTIATGVDRPRQVLWLSERHVHRQAPCSQCWARYLCGGGCHHEVLARGRPACDYIRGWLHYTIQAYGRLSALVPGWFGDNLPSRH